MAKRIVEIECAASRKIWECPMAFCRAWVTVAVVFGSITIVAGSAMAQKRYGPGASDTEIKIGNIVPYSGPASA